MKYVPVTTTLNLPKMTFELSPHALLAALCDSQDGADISFNLVRRSRDGRHGRSEVVKAHRAILCRRSEVFKGLVSGGFAESWLPCIPLKSVSYEAFMHLKRWAYTYDTSRLPAQPSAASFDDVIEIVELLTAANIFGFPELEGRCASMITAALENPESTAAVLEAVCSAEGEQGIVAAQLKHSVLDAACLQLDAMLQSVAFQNLSPITLSYLLQHDHLPLALRTLLLDCVVMQTYAGARSKRAKLAAADADRANIRFTALSAASLLDDDHFRAGAEVGGAADADEEAEYPVAAQPPKVIAEAIRRFRMGVVAGRTSAGVQHRMQQHGGQSAHASRQLAMAPGRGAQGGPRPAAAAAAAADIADVLVAPPVGENGEVIKRQGHILEVPFRVVWYWSTTPASVEVSACHGEPLSRPPYIRVTLRCTDLRLPLSTNPSLPLQTSDDYADITSFRARRST